jgi:steroid delta-isomerase-like uncharacterized protein
MLPLSDRQRATRIRAVQEHFRIENTHDLDAVIDTFGNTCSFLANNELHDGREAVRAFYAEFFHGFPDLQFDIKSLHVAEEAIPVEMVLSGTHTGTWFGIPPTGRHFEMPACAVFIFDEQDRIAGERGYFDSALLLRQLGLLPPAGSPAVGADQRTTGSS